jgi:hypothetical protein
MHYQYELARLKVRGDIYLLLITYRLSLEKSSRNMSYNSPIVYYKKKILENHLKYGNITYLC